MTWCDAGGDGDIDDECAELFVADVDDPMMMMMMMTRTMEVIRIINHNDFCCDVDGDGRENEIEIFEKRMS